MITIQDIQRLKSFKVLVIGDSCYDIYKYGTVHRMCPEAPVPVFNFLYEIKTTGMAGNVYKNLISLGIDAELVTNSEEITKTRYVDEKTNYLLLREDFETLPLLEINLDNVNLDSYNAIVISDYDKGTITPKLFKQIKKSFNGTIFVDSKKKDLSIFYEAIVKINELEMSKIELKPINSELIVTLGARGACYKGETYPAPKKQVFDVSGAGDTFMAALVVKYMLTEKIEKSISFANLCASEVVKKRGTSYVTMEEIRNLNENN